MTQENSETGGRVTSEPANLLDAKGASGAIFFFEDCVSRMRARAQILRAVNDGRNPEGLAYAADDAVDVIDEFLELWEKLVRHAAPAIEVDRS